MFEHKSLLVPVDFSQPARSAFEHALSLASGESATVLVVHVIDAELVNFAAALQLATREEIVKRVRARAAELLQEYARPADREIDVQTLICEGTPFLEIIKKAEEFYVDAVVMGRHGTRGALEKMLFGSTAEHVMRGCRRPVLMVPCATD